MNVSQEIKPKPEFETMRSCQDSIAGYAAKDFAGHTIAKITEERWLCRTPGQSSYWFFVIVCPGTVIVYGDIGDAILRMSERTTAGTLAWLRGSVESPDYMISKIVDPKRSFYPGDVIGFIEDRVKEDEGDDNDEAIFSPMRLIMHDVVEMARFGDLNQHTWSEICVDEAWDSETHGVGDGFDAHCFWTVEALKTFIRLYDAGVEQ